MSNQDVYMALALAALIGFMVGGVYGEWRASLSEESSSTLLIRSDDSVSWGVSCFGNTPFVSQVQPDTLRGSMLEPDITR